ncbi:DUF2798 domain-containing protein [Alphaproteobacteria bacterium]|nr:DUF2798 domain-containing protein [Alphaproteobacteria bacterium]MDC3311525.1 DUF2798 domain-containing protein [Alphaproteobacteria bacterium]
MPRKLFSLIIITLLSAILVTMFISALVTLLSLEDKSLFFSVWPTNWLVASIVGFFAILTMRPVAMYLGQKIILFIYGKEDT